MGEPQAMSADPDQHARIVQKLIGLSADSYASTV